MKNAKRILITERLYMREVCSDDSEAMFEMDSDALVHKYLGKKPVRSMSEIHTSIESLRQQYKANGLGRWAVINKTTGNFIGWAGLKLMDPDEKCSQFYYDLGYRFNRNEWGKGFASESAAALVKYARKNLPAKKICAYTHVENVASIKVLTKAGFNLKKKFVDSDGPCAWFELESGKARSSEKLSYEQLASFILWL
jgi:ribosomal-protein-alanine N-acetyltransferase